MERGFRAPSDPPMKTNLLKNLVLAGLVLVAFGLSLFGDLVVGSRAHASSCIHLGDCADHAETASAVLSAGVRAPRPETGRGPRAAR